MHRERASGVFCHLTSLPGPDGVGTLGAPARDFVDFLSRADQRCWQFCPVGPTTPEYGNSPYSSYSAFAGSPLFVDLDDLAARGWLPTDALADRPDVPADSVDYAAVGRYKRDALVRAFDGFRSRASEDERAGFDAFRQREADWLRDYALFMALRAEHGGPWTAWPGPLRDRDPEAIARAREEHAETVAFREFVQCCFDRQWRGLSRYAADRGVSLVGDAPIYVAHDSADAWANRDVFQLDSRGEPTHVAGVPAAEDEPFPAQRWGMPLYDWEHLEATGFDWWTRRFERLFSLCDLVRIDHFRGLDAYWSIPADEPDPNVGEWRDVPSEAFFDALFGHFGDFPAFAEDIGHLTQSVHDLRERYGFPSLRLLPFADWCDESHPHWPDNYPVSSVAYTSTHDSNTARGAYEDDLDPETRACLHEALGLDATGGEVDPAVADRINWVFLEAVWESDATLALAQLQDVLGLGSDARFNVPGTTAENWAWRVRAEQLTDAAADRLSRVTHETDRASDVEG